MPLIGAIGFGQPLLLWALVLLPAIWWLLRQTPPRPVRLIFPPLRLMFGLKDEEETPATTPWWLTALRVLLAGLVILALAAPVLRPEPGAAPGGGPLVLFVDNGWASGEDWETRLAAVRFEIERARGADEPVVLVPTATAGPAGVTPPQEAERAAERVAAGLVPLAFPPQRMAALDRAREALSGTRNARIVWLSDGIDHGSGGEFAQGLDALSPEGRVSVYLPDLTQMPLTLGAPHHDGAGFDIPVQRAASGAARSGMLRALALNDRFLGEAGFSFAGGEREVRARFDMPLELRNDIARVEIAAVRSAGAVRLVDDRWRMRRIGLITGESRDIAQPLLSPLYYVERALAPFAEMHVERDSNLAESIERVIEAQVGLIVTTDVGHIAGETHDTLSQWVERGGVLVRFAGHRLAAGADDLVPVRLREGGRTLGGTLSWSSPQPLGPFDPAGPFAGLTAPPEVTIERQVLAEPDIDLAEKTWAQLADGTPLVTGARRGRGWLVLFHVTANTAWSNLPLSGLFVDMLSRLQELAPATGEAPEAAGTAAGGAETPVISGEEARALPPVRTLDGRGALTAPAPTTRPIMAGAIDSTIASSDHPPGFYGQPDALRALNVLPHNAQLTGLTDLPDGFVERAYAHAAPLPLKPWILFAALVLLALDAIAIIYLTGLRLAPRTAGAAVLFAATLMSAAHHARAQDAAADQFALKATLETRLAYVLTANEEVNDTARRGLIGLSRVLEERTALEPGEPIGVDVARDELAFFPLIYWPIDPAAEPPEAETLARVDAFMKQGGTILFDSRDEAASATGLSPGNGPGMQALRRLLGKIDVPALEPVPVDHVLTKAFYLLQNFPGRWDGGTLWVEATQPTEADDPRPVRQSDGVSSTLITSNDFAAAWAVDDSGRPLYPVVPGGDRQREMAMRTGVNIVMYALTGNYKADQVHVPALLERLGQ